MLNSERKGWNVPTPAVPVVTQFNINILEDNLDIEIDSCKHTTEPTSDVRSVYQSISQFISLFIIICLAVDGW